MDVVRPAVQQNDRRTVGRADVDVADVEEAGRDLLDGAERVNQLLVDFFAPARTTSAA